MEALHSFSLIIRATLGDAKAHACLEPVSAQAELSTSAALDALQQLALHQQSQSQPAAASNSGRAGSTGSVSFGFSASVSYVAAQQNAGVVLLPVLSTSLSVGTAICRTSALPLALVPDCLIS